ncbi:nuclear transport factor 2 family protein [Lutibaculum baratangense]|uniref:Putative transcriptional regulator n=1 Tax=Lutibaculum baratangense AMV1 TaxID=631454 RepID=V4TIA4_9HYPH|nr:nuclear transport factor 2 family protein [Lutibaculum baratangense]ESR25733.1 putative transcriptional regulator [Lutibaculum baratangense AMV1]
MTDREIVERYGRTLETLAPDTIADLTAMCERDVHFVDPFNEVRGREGMAHVFHDMFEKLDEVGFEVEEIVGGGRIYALRFTFTAAGKMIGRVSVPGMTYVRLSEKGLVEEHVDFWDGGVLYEHMPVLGRAVRAVKKRIAA